MNGERLGEYDTLPMFQMQECRQFGYDFVQRPDKGWQMVILTRSTSWSAAMADARSRGLKLDSQGYLLK